MTWTFLIGIAVGVLGTQLWLAWCRHAVPAIRTTQHARKVATVVPIHADASTSSLLLCSRKGELEHEIAYHGPDVPKSYHYSDKDYVRMRARGHGVWEFRR